MCIYIYIERDIDIAIGIYIDMYVDRLEVVVGRCVGRNSALKLRIRLILCVRKAASISIALEI